MDFGDVFGSFWEAFGSILGSKSRSKFGVFFWTVFFAIPRRDVASTRLRRDFGAGVCAAEPPRAAPFSRAEGSYNDPKERKHEIQHAPGPEARRIYCVLVVACYLLFVACCVLCVVAHRRWVS